MDARTPTRERTERPAKADTVPQPPRARRKRVRSTQPADTVWKGTVVALVVFVVLASGNMVDSARGMPLGWQRNVAMTVSGAVDRVANFFSLNRPYDWAAAQLGIDGSHEDFEFPEAPPAPAPSATTTTLPPMRVPTAAEPLRVVVAGDSTAKSLGDALIAATEGAPLAITNEGTVSTGLARSDYFNWGAELSDIVTGQSPELVVFMVGANDGQSILNSDGTVVAQFGSPEWEAAYRERVAGIMDLAGGDGRRMVWVGEPNVGTGNVQKAVEIGNRLASEEAARRPWVTYFDVADLLAGPDGGFAEYMTMPDGSTVRCYAGDGVHLSMKCLDVVIDELVPSITGLYGSDQAAVDPTSAATNATTTPEAGSGTTARGRTVSGD